MSPQEKQILMENKAIETKEIRGVSVRTLITVIISTATIVSFVLGGVSKLSGQIKATNDEIKTFRLEKNSDAKYNDLRLKIMERDIELINKRIEAFDVIINQLKQLK